MSTEPANRIAPLSKAKHAQMRWKPFTNWRFAAGEFMVPLAGVELSRAAGNYPVIFVRGGERVEVIALLGLKRGQNVFVNAKDEWTCDYVPATLRSRPFVLGVSAEGQPLLCIDEASPLVAREDEGDPLFTEGGELSPQVQQAAGFLRGIHASLAATWKATEALSRHGCLRPLQLPENLATTFKQAKGLFQADEAALKALPPEALAELMSLDALAIAYAQIISLQKLPFLLRMAEARERENPPDLSALERDGTFVLAPLG